MTERTLPHQMRRAVLYKHYDAQGRPLYYGISSENDKRQGAHKNFGGWYQLSARCEEVEYETWSRAEAAEKEAIQADLPVFNRRYAPGWQERQFDYLAEIGRAELIQPGLIAQMDPPPTTAQLIDIGRPDLIQFLERLAKTRERYE